MAPSSATIAGQRNERKTITAPSKGCNLSTDGESVKVYLAGGPRLIAVLRVVHSGGRWEIYDGDELLGPVRVVGKLQRVEFVDRDDQSRFCIGGHLLHAAQEDDVRLPIFMLNRRSRPTPRRQVFLPLEYRELMDASLYPPCSDCGGRLVVGASIRDPLWRGKYGSCSTGFLSECYACEDCGSWFSWGRLRHRVFAVSRLRRLWTVMPKRLKQTVVGVCIALAILWTYGLLPIVVDLLVWLIQ